MEAIERADNRIPVRKDTWRRLHKLRSPGQTYDNLINDLIDVSEFLDEWIRTAVDRGEFVSIDEARAAMGLPR